MRRLWTLQERRLAANLHVQFRDEAVPVTDLLSTEPNFHTAFDSEVLNGLYWSLRREPQRFFYSVENITERFSDLTADLSTRDVTVPSDEALCLATLLDLPIENFDPFPTMMDVYSSVSSLPQSLLFLRAPKLHVPSFRWVPASLLGVERSISVPAKPTRQIDKGLLLLTDCVLFQRDFDHRQRSGLDIYFVACPKSTGFALEPFVLANGEKNMFKSAAIYIQENSRNFETTSRAVLVSDMFQRKAYGIAT